MEEPGRPLVGWRSLAEAVSDGVAVQHDGEFVHASSDLGATLGVEADALVGRAVADAFGPAADADFTTIVETARTDGQWSGRVQPRSALTDVEAVHVTLAPVTDETLVWTFEECATGTPAGGRPDTDEPDRNPPDPGTILRSVDDGVYALNEELEFTYVNDAAADLLGRSRAELLGTNVERLFDDPEERSLADRMRERAVDGDGGSGTVRATVETPDGERVLEARYHLRPERTEEFRGSVGVIRDVTEVDRLHQELRWEDRLLQNVVDALEDVLYVVDEDSEFVFWNDVALERFGYTAEEFAALHPLEFAGPLSADEESIEAWDITKIPDRYRMDLVTKDGEEIPHELHGVIYRDESTGDRYLVGVARDITAQLERERALERQRDELATLDRINGLILETVQELLTSANRDAVERAVCDRLAGSDLYQFAWIGEPELDGDRIQPRVIAGEDRDYLEAVTIADDGDAGGHPASRAMDTGDVEVTTVEDAADAAWRAAAADRDVESILAVPLAHDGTTYGVLSVYAHREDAFSERERAAFDVLGRTVGFVFYAARSRDLLFADEVVELEFALDTATSMFGNAAPTLDCTLELAGYVASGGSWIQYIEASDVDPEDVRAFAATDEEVDRVRVINEAASGGRLEVVVDRSDLLETATAAGATVRSARATPDDARIEIEAPVGADVRDVVEMVTREYEGASLVARREREREISPAARPETLLSDLTDRQRNVLRTAYEAGYFEWPRGSTAEEVADSLSIAPATLHSHLRKAEGTLLTAIFDGE